MGARRKGRILAFQVLYAWAAAGAKQREALLPELLDFSWVDGDAQGGGSEDFARLLVRGVVENSAPVDAMIRRHLKNWDFSRLKPVDLALLRLGVYTLMFQDTPPSVVIDEAVSISRDFGTDDSYRFVNGVLDGVRKTLQDTLQEKKESHE
jgi:N utilization substance protein B